MSEQSIGESNERPYLHTLKDAYERAKKENQYRTQQTLEEGIRNGSVVVNENIRKILDTSEENLPEINDSMLMTKEEYRLMYDSLKRGSFLSFESDLTPKELCRELERNGFV